MQSAKFREWTTNGLHVSLNLTEHRYKFLTTFDCSRGAISLHHSSSAPHPSHTHANHLTSRNLVVDLQQQKSDGSALRGDRPAHAWLKKTPGSKMDSHRR